MSLNKQFTNKLQIIHKIRILYFSDIFSTFYISISHFCKKINLFWKHIFAKLQISNRKSYPEAEKINDEL